MPNDRIAVAFMNGIGNFIFFTAAVKVLKNWGYEHIDLLTDDRFLKIPAMVDIAEGHFDNVLTEYDVDSYDRVFVARWSEPMNLKEQIEKVRPKKRLINWHHEGIHEVQEYLEMIGATWRDFDGFLFESADGPILEMPHPRVALANCSKGNQAVKKRWDKFPELSETLVDLGYEVILLGLGDELDGCIGHDFRDQLTIFEAGKVLEQCDFLIAASTGLALVADAVKTPVILLEGPMATFRAHPVQSKYHIVRRYYSCAPCWQKSLWYMCSDPACMNNLEVGHVIQGMFKFLPKMKRDVYYRRFEPLPTLLGEPMKCNRKILYLVPCFNRYERLKQFFDSFEKSYPVDGVMLILNDASTDPRVQNLIDVQIFPNIRTLCFKSDSVVKNQLRLNHRVNESLHAYNRLIDESKKVDDSLDYVLIIDPDILMKPYWVQKLVNMYEEIQKKRRDVGILSPLNADHGGYDGPGSKEVFETSYGSYRVRKGSNLPYLMSMKFFKEVHGKFDVNGMKSSDIGKSMELLEKGFRAAAAVPSLVQHAGAFETSFYRTKPPLTARDFGEESNNESILIANSQDFSE